MLTCKIEYKVIFFLMDALVKKFSQVLNTTGRSEIMEATLGAT